MDEIVAIVASGAMAGLLLSWALNELKKLRRFQLALALIQVKAVSDPRGAADDLLKLLKALNADE